MYHAEVKVLNGLKDIKLKTTTSSTYTCDICSQETDGSIKETLWIKILPEGKKIELICCRTCANRVFGYERHTRITR